MDAQTKFELKTATIQQTKLIKDSNK